MQGEADTSNTSNISALSTFSPHNQGNNNTNKEKNKETPQCNNNKIEEKCISEVNTFEQSNLIRNKLIPQQSNTSTPLPPSSSFKVSCIVLNYQ